MKTLPRWSFSKASSANFLALLATGVLLLNLLVASIAGLSLYSSRTQYETRALVATQNLAQLLEHDIAAAIDKIDLALLAHRDEIAGQLAAGGIDARALNAFIAQQLARQPDLESLRFANSAGDLEYGTGIQSGSLTNIADREYFVQLRDHPGAGLVISKPLVGRLSKEWVIVLARRVDKPDAAFAGTVFATIALKQFQKMFSALDLGSRGAVSLRDKDLFLLARHSASNGPNVVIGSKTVSKELEEIARSNAASGTYVAYTKMDSIERANAYRRVSAYPLYVIVGLATDDFLGGWRDEAIKTSALVACFLAATLALSWLLHRSWKAREELARHVMVVQEEERRRLAAELHDNTSPNLAALALNLRMIAADLPAGFPAKLETRLADTRNLLESTTTGIRDVCAYLRPATLDYASLRHALQEYAEQVSRRTGIAVQVSGPVQDTRLPPDTETLLFRIAQEALTNCAKHAKASAINIDLAHDSAHAMLTITDNGVGFDPAALGHAGHRPGLGLLSMRERVERAGGRFEIGSQPGKGTRIQVKF